MLFTGFEGKTALVTGGASGIGLAVGKRLAEAGTRGVIERMGRETSGIIIYLREGSVGMRQDEEDHREVRQRSQDWREIGLGAQILRSLGIPRISLLASKPRRYVGLEGFGIEIAKTELIDDFANSKSTIA